MNKLIDAPEDTSESHEAFLSFGLPEAPDQERRREEARIILATLLARHILAQEHAKADTRNAA
jgi:hypothetical protein